MQFTVRDLLRDRSQPVSVQLTDTVETAVALMEKHDFGQLPIVDGQGRPQGMVTHESILRAMYLIEEPIGKLQLAHARVDVDARVYDADSYLFNLFDELKRRSAVLIVDGQRQLEGIITSWDVMEFFRKQTQDFLLVQQVEETLKQFILLRITDENAAQLQAEIDELLPHRRGADFQDLYFREYILLFTHQKVWPLYEPVFRLSHVAMERLLRPLNKVRNRLAHFRGDLSSDEQGRLLFCNELLARHEAEVRAAFAKPSPPPTPNVVEPDEPEAPLDEEQSARDRKYTPLARWLEAQPAEPGWVRLTFAQIEHIIGAELPSGARQPGAWWANDSVGHVQSIEWLSAGWRVSSVDFGEQAVEFSRIKERERAYIEFFGELLADLRKDGRFTGRDSPSRGVHWQVLDRVYHEGKRLGLLAFSFSRSGQARIELYIDTGNGELNKRLFDAVASLQQEVHKELGTDLAWERIDDKRASRIAWYHDGSIVDDPDDLTSLRAWAVSSMPLFNQSVRKRFQEAARGILRRSPPTGPTTASAH
jgi:CBS domain-containing protein